MGERERGVGWGKQPRAAGEPMVSDSNSWNGREIDNAVKVGEPTLAALSPEVERLRYRCTVHGVTFIGEDNLCHHGTSGPGNCRFPLVPTFELGQQVLNESEREYPPPPRLRIDPVPPWVGYRTVEFEDLHRGWAKGSYIAVDADDAAFLINYFQVAYALGRLFEGDDESQTEVGFWDVVVALNDAFPQFDWHNVMTDGPARTPK